MLKPQCRRMSTCESPANRLSSNDQSLLEIQQSANNKIAMRKPDPRLIYQRRPLD